MNSLCSKFKFQAKPSLISVQLCKQKQSALRNEPSVLITVHSLQIQLHSIMEKLKDP